MSSNQMNKFTEQMIGSYQSKDGSGPAALMVLRSLRFRLLNRRVGRIDFSTRFFLLVLCSCISVVQWPSLFARAAEPRVWRDAAGVFEKVGTLERISGAWVHLNLEDGDSIKVPLTWLSDADRAYVESQAEPESVTVAEMPEEPPTGRRVVTRVWTAGGYKTEAAFERIQGETVILKLPEGKLVEVKLSDLSVPDQDYIRQIISEAEKENPFRPHRSGDSESTGSRMTQADSAESDQVSSLTVEGLGLSKGEAEKDAYRNAVRQVVGAFVDAETVIANDAIIRDEVITLSAGYVQEAKTRRAYQEDGLFKVIVDVKVQVTKLLTSLKTHNIAVVEIDPADIQSAIAKAATLAEQKEGQTELLRRALRTYPEGCIRVKVDGKPAITSGAIEFRLTVEPAMDAFEAVADKVCKVFSTDGRPHGILRGDPTYYRNNDPEYGRNDATRDCVDRFHNRHQLGLSDYGYPGRGDEETIKLSGLLTLTAQTNKGPLALEQAVLSTGASVGSNPHNGYWVVIPVRANSELRRINWHWFRFQDRKELEQFIGEYQHGVGIGIELVDSDGMVVADDLVGIDMGWNHFGWPNSTPSISILSPFLCAKTNYQKVFFKTFSFKRKIELTQEEATRVRELKCSLQAAAWGTPSEVVRDSRTR